MPEAFIIDAVRTPVSRARRRPGQRAPGRPAARTSSRPCWPAPRLDPGAVDDVVFGCVDTVGPQAGDIARTALARGGPARGGARRHRRPAVRLVPAGRALRRAGGAQRHRRPGGRGRRAEHEHGPDRLGRWQLGTDPFSGLGGLAGPVRRPRRSPSSARADLIAAEVGHRPRRDGALRAGQPPAGGPGDRRRRFDAEIAPYRERNRGRGPAPRHDAWRRWPRCSRCARAA